MQSQTRCVTVVGTLAEVGFGDGVFACSNWNAPRPPARGHMQPHGSTCRLFAPLGPLGSLGSLCWVLFADLAAESRAPCSTLSRSHGRAHINGCRHVDHVDLQPESGPQLRRARPNGGAKWRSGCPSKAARAHAPLHQIQTSAALGMDLRHPQSVRTFNYGTNTCNRCNLQEQMATQHGAKSTKSAGIGSDRRGDGGIRLLRVRGGAGTRQQGRAGTRVLRPRLSHCRSFGLLVASPLPTLH